MPSPANLVHETSTTTGTGNLTVAAVNGKVRFSDSTYAFGTGGSDVFDYFIMNQAAAEWEIGTGSMSDANTFVRDTVVFSSNSDALVDFSAGTKDITNDVPAAFQGDVFGPASSTDGNLPSFSGTGGKTLQDSGIAAANVVQASGNLTDNALVAGSGGTKGAKTYTGLETISDLDDVAHTSVYPADDPTSNRPSASTYMVLTMRRTAGFLTQLAHGRDNNQVYVRQASSSTWGSWLRLLKSDEIIDEDDMASDSASHVPTQQSVKAYVDANLGWNILAASGVAASHTGDTTETTLATVTIPAGAMGANGVLRINSIWRSTDGGSPATRQPRIRLGGTSGTSYGTATLGTGATTTQKDERTIYNRNSESSQIGFGSGAGSGGWGNSTAVATSSVDTSSATSIFFRGQLSNAGDTIILEAYMVEVFYQP